MTLLEIMPTWAWLAAYSFGSIVCVAAMGFASERISGFGDPDPLTLLGLALVWPALLVLGMPVALCAAIFALGAKIGRRS